MIVGSPDSTRWHPFSNSVDGTRVQKSIPLQVWDLGTRYRYQALYLVVWVENLSSWSFTYRYIFNHEGIFDSLIGVLQLKVPMEMLTMIYIITKRTISLPQSRDTVPGTPRLETNKPSAQ